MPGGKAKMKIISVQEANALLPGLHVFLESLRELRTSILRTQAQIEIEEMTGSGSGNQLTPAAQEKVIKCMDTLRRQSSQFEEILDRIIKMGALLKDLDEGLVDFYTNLDGEIVFLCWKEGEKEIQHWHSLEEGFQNRKELP